MDTLALAQRRAGKFPGSAAWLLEATEERLARPPFAPGETLPTWFPQGLRRIDEAVSAGPRYLEQAMPSVNL
ncbi:hypothetical protein BHS09_29150 [Myxococcus xanthus]|uniref:Uncharacterized protein n=1 Tax=Myxococcus xanthus TaxID=34 RepID=A0AAE6G4E9_MYXXA|nr:hypothetical protein [Myxococcus xanthus]QDE70712.1 hypothetical protein BHS09_29150 [Myxococcus xanthus]QDE77991.1 hypothetical protein BHS08_29170 [Myxococcus xanthus]